jgi:hypothetical protein
MIKGVAVVAASDGVIAVAAKTMLEPDTRATITADLSRPSFMQSLSEYE